MRELAHLVVGASQRQPRVPVGLPPQQPLQLAVELLCPAQQLGAQRAELLLFEQQVLADAGVEHADRFLGQLEPCPLALVGGRQLVVGAGHLRVGDGQLGVGRVQVGIRPGLDRQHGRRPDQGHEHRGGRGRHGRSVPPRPSPGPPRANGSRQAVTGSSAIHRSRSSARALGVGYRSAGPVAMAFRQTASSALSSAGSCWEGRGNCPSCTARKMTPMSSLSNGGLPVSRQ